MAHIPIARVNPWPTVPADDPIRTGKPRPPEPEKVIVTHRVTGDGSGGYRHERWPFSATVTLFGKKTVKVYGRTEDECRDAAYALPEFYCLSMD